MIYILPWCSLEIPLVIDVLHVLLIILLIFGEKKILLVSKYSSSPCFSQIIIHLLMLPGICLRKKRGGGGRVIVLQSSAVLALAWGPLQNRSFPLLREKVSSNPRHSGCQPGSQLSVLDGSFCSCSLPSWSSSMIFASGNFLWVRG